MKELKLLAFALLVQMHVAVAQKNIFQFKIVDSASGNKLGYATIVLDNNASIGAVADSNGRGAVVLTSAGQTCFRVTAIGYADKRVCAGNDDLIVVGMRPIAKQLATATVSAKGMHEEELGTVKLKTKIKFSIGKFFSYQQALVIDNPEQRRGFIQSISYYFLGGLIWNMHNSNAPFRVRVYEIEDSCHCPGRDLLQENVVVSNTKGSGWFTVDMRAYKLSIPEKGFAVAMEWIDSGPTYEYTRKVEVKNADGKIVIREEASYGQAMTLSSGTGIRSTWAKSGTGEWEKYGTGIVDTSHAVNVAIKTKVLVN
jgi:hypothetical protein